MRRKVKRLAVVTVAAALGIGAASVPAEETSRGGYELGVSAKKPGRSTGLSFHVLYKHPEDPEGKPPPVASAVFELPAGMRIDDGAIPRCAASDEEFRQLGREACPAETRVGDGALTAMTGFPGADPVAADVVAFNGEGEVIEVVFFEGTNVVAGIDRLTIEGDNLVAHPPSTPGGPPDGRTTVREVRLELPPRTGADGRAYVTAPPACPNGHWASRAHYEFEDGATTTLTSVSPCKRPAVRVAAAPKRVRAGERVAIRLVARSADDACVRHARVRVAGRRTRTNARGRTTVRTTFENPGRKRAIVTKGDCRTGRATIRVRPGR